MPVDFAIKVADLACEELGMVNEEDDRRIFADDSMRIKEEEMKKRRQRHCRRLKQLQRLGGWQ